MINNPAHEAQILGSIIVSPTLIDEYAISPRIFTSKFKQLLFSVCYNLYKTGVEDLNAIVIDKYIASHPSAYVLYNAENGLEKMLSFIEEADVPNFSYYFNMCNKYALLRDIQADGHDTSYFFCESLISDQKEMIHRRLEDATTNSIVAHYQNSILAVSAPYMQSSSAEKLAKASDGARELLASLKLAPDFGKNLDNNGINTVVRGARLGKYFLYSGGTGGGKSRFMIKNAVYLAFPFHYDWGKKQWIQHQEPNKVSFISTELELDEVQTIVFASLSGIDEAKILSNSLTEEQEKVLQETVSLMEFYKDNLSVYLMPDPNIKALEQKIVHHVIKDEIKYLFFDYIHTSPSLLAEFTSSRVREDVVLNYLASYLATNR